MERKEIKSQVPEANEPQDAKGDRSPSGGARMPFGRLAAAATQGFHLFQRQIIRLAQAAFVHSREGGRAIRQKVHRFYHLHWPSAPVDQLHVAFANRAYNKLSRKHLIIVVGTTWSVLLLLPYSFLAVAALLVPIQPSLLPPLQDYPLLFILTVLAPWHCTVELKIWRYLEITFRALQRAQQMKLDAAEIKDLIRKYNSLFNSRLFNAVAVPLSIGVGYWFVIARSNHLSWWGSPAISGYAFVVAVFVCSIVWYHLLQHTYKGVIAVLLFREVFRPGIHLVIFHQDGVYGLGNIARILLLAYTTTIVHGMAIVALWRGRFLSSEEPLLILFLAAFFVICVPLFYGFPAFLLHQTVYRFKQSLRVQVRTVIPGPPSRHHLLLTLLADHLIEGLPKSPFSKRTLLLSGFCYSLQLASAVVTVAPVISIK